MRGQDASDPMDKSRISRQQSLKAIGGVYGWWSKDPISSSRINTPEFRCRGSIRVFKEMVGKVTCDLCSRLGQDGPTELVTSDLLTITSGPEQ